MPVPAAQTIALAGATGFIGRRIAAHLTASGHRVLAPVRPGSRRAGMLPEGVEIVPAQLAAGDPGLLRAIRDADAVVYAAGSVRGTRLDDFLPANVEGVRAAAEAIGDTRIPLLLISSLAAAEPQLSDYARSKREGERTLENLPGIRWTALRAPAVYGPGDREIRPIFDWIGRGLAPRIGGPDQRVSLLHVDDLARAVALWIDRAAAAAEPAGIFELHDGREGGYPFEEIVAAAAGARAPLLLAVPGWLLATLGRLNAALARAGCRPPPMLTPGKARELRHPRWVCDNRAIAAALGWQPAIGLREGVAALRDPSGANAPPSRNLLQ